MSKGYVIYEKDQMEMMSSEINTILNSSQIVWLDEKWEQYDLGTVCMTIREWKALQIILDHNYNKNIVKEIAQIRFPYLLVLHLQNNNIESVQPLQRIHMPSINKLSFDHNHISSIKEIRKVNWQHFQELSLYGNKIKEAKELSEIGCDLVRLFAQISILQNSQIYDISWLAKMKTFNKIGLQDKNRIFQPRLVYVFDKKFKTMILC